MGLCTTRRPNRVVPAGFLERRTSTCPPAPAQDGSAPSGPGLVLTVDRAHLGCSGCPQSSLRVIRLLGDALGSPPPGKLQLLPGIIIAWIITRFRACWRILGWCQSGEAGFRDCGRLLLLRAETQRKRVTVQLPKNPTWQGPGFGKCKAKRGRKLMSSLCSPSSRHGSPGF